tara:strand:- start:95 stop:433 length:339 start_codon:yes stop_codon:yes gene_type:complete
MQNDLRIILTKKNDFFKMKINVDTVKKIANLARIEVKKDELAGVAAELSEIVSFMEELNEANVTTTPPMTSVTPMRSSLRDDEITDGGDAGKILGNAPEKNEGFFTVPKVIE